jgi:hypothetical protein
MGFDPQPSSSSYREKERQTDRMAVLETLCKKKKSDEEGTVK